MRTVLAATVLLLAAGPAFAHRLNVKPTVVGDQLRVEAYYDDDTPSQEAKVTLTRDGELVASGRTDEKGIWTTPRPKAGTYVVRAESVGHAAKDSFEVTEPEPTAAPAVEPPPAEPTHHTPTPWRELATGLGIIAGLWVVWQIARRNRNQNRQTSP
jgi:hypothetical protein